MTIRFGAETSAGKCRDKNEDAFLALESAGVFAVADGVGGQSSGEIASKKAMDGVKAYVKKNPIPSGEEKIDDYFNACFEVINADISKLANSKAIYSGMATTATLAYFDKGVCYLLNVGDSRAYSFSGGKLSQRTKDHTYVNDLLDAGKIDESEIEAHPQKNVITRALGSAPITGAEFFTYKLKKGDGILLCTDGLHSELANEQIAQILESAKTPETASKTLINAANENGGRDNITVIYIKDE